MHDSERLFAGKTFEFERRHGDYIEVAPALLFSFPLESTGCSSLFTLFSPSFAARLQCPLKKSRVGQCVHLTRASERERRFLVLYPETCQMKTPTDLHSSLNSLTRPALVPHYPFTSHRRVSGMQTLAIWASGRGE